MWHVDGCMASRHDGCRSQLCDGNHNPLCAVHGPCRRPVRSMCAWQLAQPHRLTSCHPLARSSCDASLLRCSFLTAHDVFFAAATRGQAQSIAGFHSATAAMHNPVNKPVELTSPHHACQQTAGCTERAAHMPCQPCDHASRCRCRCPCRCRARSSAGCETHLAPVFSPIAAALRGSLSGCHCNALRRCSGRACTVPSHGRHAGPRRWHHQHWEALRNHPAACRELLRPRAGGQQFCTVRLWPRRSPGPDDLGHRCAAGHRCRGGAGRGGCGGDGGGARFRQRGGGASSASRVGPPACRGAGAAAEAGESGVYLL